MLNIASIYVKMKRLRSHYQENYNKERPKDCILTGLVLFSEHG